MNLAELSQKTLINQSFQSVHPCHIKKVSIENVYHIQIPSPFISHWIQHDYSLDSQRDLISDLDSKFARLYGVKLNKFAFISVEVGVWIGPM